MALWRRKSKQVSAVAPPVDVEIVEPVPIAPDDPLLDYLQKLARPIEVEKIEVESPALEEMKAANIELLVPLVTQGELVGILNLGPRLSERDYSTDDRKCSTPWRLSRSGRAGRNSPRTGAQRSSRAHRPELRVAPDPADVAPRNFRRSPGGRSTSPPGERSAATSTTSSNWARGGRRRRRRHRQGVPAALVMATCGPCCAAAEIRRSRAGAGRGQRLAPRRYPPSMFVTCFAVIDTHTGPIHMPTPPQPPYVRTETGSRTAPRDAARSDAWHDLRGQGAGGPRRHDPDPPDGVAEAHGLTAMFGSPD